MEWRFPLLEYVPVLLRASPRRTSGVAALLRARARGSESDPTTDPVCRDRPVVVLNTHIMNCHMYMCSPHKP